MIFMMLLCDKLYYKRTKISNHFEILVLSVTGCNFTAVCIYLYVAQYPGRIAGGNGVGRYIFGNDRAGTDHGIVAYRHPGQYNGTGAYPDPFA